MRGWLDQRLVARSTDWSTRWATITVLLYHRLDHHHHHHHRLGHKPLNEKIAKGMSDPMGISWLALVVSKNSTRVLSLSEEIETTKVLDAKIWSNICQPSDVHLANISHWPKNRLSVSRTVLTDRSGDGIMVGMDVVALVTWGCECLADLVC
ncbi:hypothetical protein M405DRAFT_199674 [Rhizopogon salebrosus TDB-379]|nr:hypothetical protein M405DRAFT_199674 [Rhizopogon salebrosus TDB-379]